MQLPKDVKIEESSTSLYWFEGELLLAKSKKAPRPSLETLMREMEEFKKRLNGKKICGIFDVAESSPSSKEERAFSTRELPHVFKAMAFIIKSPLARMLAHLYMGVKPLPFPVKMCSDEQEAREWIRQYL